jgi:hypothetical protein
MLAEKLVSLEVVQEISEETVRRTLIKGGIKPWVKKQWCIPGELNARFVCCMEDVLELYKEPYDPKRPTVCFEELPYQLVSEKRLPLPAKSMAARSATTASTSGKGFATYWCSSNPKPLGDTST